jgi:hypothetical protein
MPSLRADRWRRRAFVSRADMLRGRRRDTVQLRGSVPQNYGGLVCYGHQPQEVAQREARRAFGLVVRQRRSRFGEIFPRSLHVARCARDVRQVQRRGSAILRELTVSLRMGTTRRVDVKPAADWPALAG